MYEPGDARRLLHDLVAWSAVYGCKPHPDHAAVERLFGSVDCSAGRHTIRSGSTRILEVAGRLAGERLLEDDWFDLDGQAEAAD